MKKKSQELLKRYEQLLSNLIWHRDTNKPIGHELGRLNERIDDYQHFVKDIKAFLGVESSK